MPEKKKDLEIISVNHMDKEISKIVKKPRIAIQVGEVTMAYEIPDNTVTKILRGYSAKSRVVATISDLVKIGIDFK